MLFLVGSFIDILTIHAEAGSRTGSIQIIYKENWILTEDSETKISSFIDKFTQHTIIISHDMGGMNEAD